jgi:hypothetical protein
MGHYGGAYILYGDRIITHEMKIEEIRIDELSKNIDE